MRDVERTLPRRTIIGAAAAGVGAGLVATVGGARRAQGTAAGDIWGGEYTATKDSVSLYLYRKRLGAPRPGEPPLPVLMLVHGSSSSSRPTFDLTVPGHGDYSVMNAFAEWGFDVWTMDHES